MANEQHGFSPSILEIVSLKDELAALPESADHRIKFLKRVIALQADQKKRTDHTTKEIVAVLLLLAGGGVITLAMLLRFKAQLVVLLSGLHARIVGDALQVFVDSAKDGALVVSDEAQLASDIDTIARDAASQIIRDGALGYPFSESIERQIMKAEADILARLRRATILEEPPGKWSADIETIVNQKLPITIAAVTGTELNGAYNAGLKEAGGKSGSLVGYFWEISPAHDWKLGCICEDLEGKVYPPGADQLAMFPGHPNCWCFLRPQFNNKES